VKVQPTTAGLVVVIVALSVALAFSSCPRPDPESGKIPAELEKTADSLEATRPAADDRRDSVVRVVVVDTARARKAEALAKAAKLEAEGSRKQADSLARLASTSADSAALWRQAYERRTEEADQLRTANAAADSALQAERSARVNLQGLFNAAEARRRTAEEVVIPGLRQAIAQLEKPCRIVGPIPCPSRKTSAVLATAATVAALSSRR